jgi:hypothetical protein
MNQFSSGIKKNMKLTLVTNENPTISPPRGILKLISKRFTAPSRYEFKSYAFQVFAPNASIPIVQKHGSWTAFMEYMKMTSFQSQNRELIFDDSVNAYVVACANICPILEDGELGEMQRVSLLIPKYEQTPILLVHNNIHYFKPLISKLAK